MLRKLQALSLKLFGSIDGSENSTPYFFTGLHFPRNFICPVVGYMAVRTSGPNARAVFVVHGILQLFVNVVFHFMAADAKRFRVCNFEGRVEAAPEDNASDKTGNDNQPQADVDGWAI